MRKRSKGGRGSRALGARNGRGNSRVNGSARSSPTVGGGVGGGRGKRGGRSGGGPNSGNGSESCKESDAQMNGNSFTNGMMMPILTKNSIPEQYYRKNPVGSGSGVRASNILKALSSDYYLHKKFKKLTTTLDDEGGEEGESKTVSSDGVIDSSSSSSKSSEIAHNVCNTSNKKSDSGRSTNGGEPGSGTLLPSTDSLNKTDDDEGRTREERRQDLLNNKNEIDNSRNSNSAVSNRHESLEIGQEQIRGDAGFPLSHSCSSSLNSSNPIDLTRVVAGTSSDNNKSCNTSRDISLIGAGSGSTSSTTNNSLSKTLNEGSTKVAKPLESELDDTSSSPSKNTSSGMVYKPKFRIAPDTSVPDPPSGMTGAPESRLCGSGDQPRVKPEGGKPPPSLPERINGEQRLDRKSLDDHISKLIDENQSILSTWPEHLKKRLKSQVHRLQEQQQQQLPSVPLNFSSSFPQHPQQRSSQSAGGNPPSSMVILSGGCTSESPVIEIPTNGIHRQYRQMCVPSSPILPVQQTHFAIRSHGDFSAEPVMLKKPFTPLHLKDNRAQQQQQYVPPPAFPSGGAVNINRNSSPPAHVVGSNGELNLTVVPKKRRRLSPTPNRLCGGEVSELPVNEPVSLVSGKNGLYQDVDMTVRVSNCGTSGAKVTIRTSPNTMNHTNANVPINYSPLLDVPSSPVKLPRVSSSMYSSHPPTFQMNDNPSMSPLALSKPKPVFPYESNFQKETQKPMSLITTDFRHNKSRGRPPKKGRLLETVQVPEPTGPSSLLMTSPVKQAQFQRASQEAVSLVLPLEPKREIDSTSGSTAPSDKRWPRPLPTTSTSPGLPPVPPMTPIKIETNVKVEPEEQDERSNSSQNPPTPVPKSETNEDSNAGSIFVETSPPNPKRPNFLAIKPSSMVSKKFQNGVLPSPDTPRIAKPYNQMHINGNAYTYLGFKVSTRSSYTCLFKPQPMFIPQETDAKLSMYSNWQPRSRNRNQDGVGISTNDSRVNGRKSPRDYLYTSAGASKCETETVNSPDQHSPIWSFGDMSPSTPTKLIPSRLAAPLPSPSLSMKSGSNPDDSPVPQSSNAPASNSLLKSAHVNTAPTSIDSAKVQPLSSGGQPSVSQGRRQVEKSSLTVTQAETDIVPPASAIPSSSLGSRYLSDISSEEGESSSSGPTSETRTRKYSENRGPFRTDEDAVKREFGYDSQSSSTKPAPGDSAYERRYSGSPNPSNTNSSDDIDDERSSSGAAGRYDSNHPRVRIMEGGFESNEDYTYVRGRGRGRYVCEACGIRCKKPSMLRKHLKTHTDLRPYTCKLCSFSFKTKGNLTKHQKSKSHHKKCIGMGIHPDSVQSLEMTGPAFSDTNTDDSDDDDATDSQEDIDVDDVSSSYETGPEALPKTALGPQSFEKEIAQSLLDLSKISRMQSDSPVDSQSTSSIPSQSPTPPVIPRPVPPTEAVNEPFYARNHKKFGPRNYATEDTNSCSPFSTSTEAPMDLSRPQNKASSNDNVEHEAKKLKLEINGNIRSFGVVGEAQRWEPENEFSITGCLNLKKVPNENKNEPSSEFRPGVGPFQNFAPAVSPRGNNGGVNGDVKPVIHVLDFSNHVSGGTPSQSAGPSSSLSLQASSGPSIARNVGPPSASDNPAVKDSHPNMPGTSHSTSSASQPPPAKPQRLHQPWLSPPASKQPVEIPPPEISPRGSSVAQMQAEAIERKVFEHPIDFHHVDPSTSSIHASLTACNDVKPGSHITSPNAKLMAHPGGLKPQAEFRPPNGPQALVKDEGKAECTVCGKSFGRASQLNLHMNIHYLERPFRCDPCGVSFRTKGHLIKHRRSSGHDSKVKVYLNDSWGVANEENPRPFKCGDCKIAFRIHGHLAKHLRSKMHILRMECLGKLPFGIYFEMEKSGLNLTEIDTSDCDMSLISLQGVAKKIYGDSWMDRLQVPVDEQV